MRLTGASFFLFCVLSLAAIFHHALLHFGPRQHLGASGPSVPFAAQFRHLRRILAGEIGGLDKRVHLRNEDA